MKKTFPLTAPGKDAARARDKIRHELNKYLRREHQKPLPEGFARLAFECKIGPDAASATPRPVNELPAAIDQIAAAGATSVYIEIVARPEARPSTR